MRLSSRKVPGELASYQKGNEYSFPVCGDILGRLLEADDTLEFSPKLQDALDLICKAQASVLEISEMTDDPDGDERLFPYQRVAVKWLVEGERGILADEQGLGKTVMAVSAARICGPRRAVIVCPSSKISDWFEHVLEWIPEDQSVCMLEGDAKNRARIVDQWVGGGQYLVTNYERAELHADDLSANAELVIVDEAHKIRNRKTGLTAAIRKVCRKARYVFLITASPTVNSATDIWPLLNICDPDRFGSFWGFVFRFCKTDDDGYGIKIGGLKPSEGDRFERILRPYILHRENQLGLTASEMIEVEYKLGGEQLRLYKDMDKFAACSYGDSTIEQLDVLSQITRLRQLALHPGLIFDNYVGPSKLDILPYIIESAPGQVVVFTMYANLVHLAVATLGVRYGIVVVGLTGDMSARERSENLAAFRSGAARAIVVTHGTGGEGLDLVEADRAIFLDLAWHPAGNDHAAKRILRYGQKSKETKLIFIHSSGTIEDHVRDIVLSKRPVTLNEILRLRATNKDTK